MAMTRPICARSTRPKRDRCWVCDGRSPGCQRFFARSDTNIFCVSFARCTTIPRLHTAAALMARDVQRAVGLNAALMADQAWLLFGVEAAMSGVIAMVVAVRGNRIAGSSGLRKAACV